MIFHLHKLYATYKKYNHETGEVYVGRTSGWVKLINLIFGRKIVEKRDKYHHKNKDGFEEAELDKFSTDEDAIRGREQLLIEGYKKEEKCGNTYNGISPRNKKKAQYIEAALRVFGDIIVTTSLWHIFISPIFY